MNNAIKTIEHAGLTIKIYQDEDYQESPDDWGDKSVFLVGFHRDFTIKRDGFGIEVCRAIAGDKDEDEHVLDRAKEVKKQYHVFGLEAYIHGGIALALSQEGNFPDRRWDVSQLGMVFVAKKEARTRAKARELAHGLIETWKQNLSGDIYGYVVEDKDGEHLDSCWGYYGDDAVIESSKAAAESCAADIRAKHEAKLKQQIKAGAPLKAREPITL